LFHRQRLSNSLQIVIEKNPQIQDKLQTNDATSTNAGHQADLARLGSE
jgi:hypothetical protein